MATAWQRRFKKSRMRATVYVDSPPSASGLNGNDSFADIDGYIAHNDGFSGADGFFASDGEDWHGEFGACEDLVVGGVLGEALKCSKPACMAPGWANLAA